MEVAVGAALEQFFEKHLDVDEVAMDLKSNIVYPTPDVIWMIVVDRCPIYLGVKSTHHVDIGALMRSECERRGETDIVGIKRLISNWSSFIGQNELPSEVEDSILPAPTSSIPFKCKVSYPTP
jgi:hypothetical protein